MRKTAYQVTDQVDRRKIAEYLSKDRQLLLPLLELICNTENAIDEVIDLVGRSALEAILMLSAEQVDGPKQPGKVRGEIGWHGQRKVSGKLSITHKYRLVLVLFSVSLPM